MNQSRQSAVIADRIELANSFWKRLKGRLGTSDFPDGQGLWIKDCSSIHTFFMQYALDCIFVDRQLRVVKVYENLMPFRMTPIHFRASAVFELPPGTLRRSPVQKGDQLHVGT